MTSKEIVSKGIAHAVRLARLIDVDPSAENELAGTQLRHFGSKCRGRRHKKIGVHQCERATLRSMETTFSRSARKTRGRPAIADASRLTGIVHFEWLQASFYRVNRDRFEAHAPPGVNAALLVCVSDLIAVCVELGHLRWNRCNERYRNHYGYNVAMRMV